MTLEQTQATTPYRRLAALGACVVVVALTLTWVFLGMRAVMDVGGSCAEGGPYEIAQPCPDGSWMLALGIPVMMIVSMGGTLVAGSVSAPNLLFPMWVLLFGSLGWNFLEYGLFSGELVWGWIICGVVFELMALPVLLLGVPRRRNGSRWTPTSGAATTAVSWWWPAYVGLGLVGCALAVVSFRAWS